MLDGSRAPVVCCGFETSRRSGGRRSGGRLQLCEGSQPCLLACVAVRVACVLWRSDDGRGWREAAGGVRVVCVCVFFFFFFFWCVCVCVCACSGLRSTGGPGRRQWAELRAASARGGCGVRVLGGGGRGLAVVACGLSQREKGYATGLLHLFEQVCSARGRREERAGGGGGGPRCKAMRSVCAAPAMCACVCALGLVGVLGREDGERQRE